MSSSLKDAMEFIQSHVDNIQKELKVTKVTLNERTQLLDKEIKKNLKLSAELEKVRSELAQLSLEFNRLKQSNPTNVTGKVRPVLSLSQRPSGTLNTYNQTDTGESKEFSNHLSITSYPHKSLRTSKDSDDLQVLGPIQSYRTQRGKLLAGWFIDFLPREVVQSIDPYTFLVKGRFFVREKYKSKLLQTISKWSKSQSVNETAFSEIKNKNNTSVLENSIQKLNTQIEVLDKLFTFRFSALKDDELFSFESVEKRVIAFNPNHQYIKKASPQSNGSFWDSLKMFIALWATAKVSGLSVNADENSQIAKGRFMRCLKEYMGGCIQYDTEFIKLPSSVLFDSRSTESGIVLLVNDSHPFNETYVQPLPDIEKNIFIQIYAAWLHAERDTLSNITENALKGTREMLGLHFYHLVDEINHGEELF